MAGQLCMVGMVAWMVQYQRGVCLTLCRLDESIPVETKLKFSEMILDMLELNSIGHLLVGSDTGGLSFEQRKR